MLEILASVKNCADKKFEVLERLVVNHVAVVSGCICVLQRWDGPRQTLVEKLRHLGVPLLVLIIVPRGGNHPLPEASESLHVLEIGKIEETLAKLK